jgi:hypothetical protein
MEEINLQGPLGNTDTRVINSYPSKVCQLSHAKVGFISTRDKNDQKVI